MPNGRTWFGGIEISFSDNRVSATLDWIKRESLIRPTDETKGNDERGICRLRLKCDGTRAETRFRLSTKRTSPFKSTRASVQSTTGSRVVRISCSNAGYTMFRGSVKSTGYPLHSPVSPSLLLPASPCAITFQLDSNFPFVCKHLVNYWYQW